MGLKGPRTLPYYTKADLVIAEGVIRSTCRAPNPNSRGRAGREPSSLPCAPPFIFLTPDHPDALRNLGYAHQSLY